jgi:hypothetical protein
MQSDHDGSMQYGKIMKKEAAERRLRRLRETGNADTKEAAALKFSVEVIAHNE